MFLLIGQRSLWHEPLLPRVAYFHILMPPAHSHKCKRNNWMPPLLFLCNSLRKKWVMKMIFWMQINIKVSYQLILTLFPSKIPASWFYQYWWTWSSVQSTRNNKFAMTSQYLEKEFRDGLHFLHANKHKFLQVRKIILDESGQTCPNYPK